MYDMFEVQRVLVIAPLRVAETTWVDEAREWSQLAHLKIRPILGTERERLAALEAKADIYTINRENVVWLVEHYGKSWPFDMVVIDESSSFKNPKAKRFKALRHVRGLISHIVALTGTPAPNGLMDLWSQVFLLDRGERLGKTIGQYRRRWFTPGSGVGYVVYEWLPVKGAKEEIYKAISDICVSMKSEDYVSLPPVLYNTIRIKLPQGVKEHYRQLERDLILEHVPVERTGAETTDIVAGTAAALSNKLLQLASGFAYDENGEAVDFHTAKLQALEELTDNNQHKPLMVFYWFKHDLERLQKAFPRAVHLNGAQDIRNWNAGKIPMLLVHPASAGHGLNLQHGGSIIVWYGLSWSLELYQQANKRLHRSGQQHTVVVHHLVAEGTIDEDVIAALGEKKVGQDALMEAIKARIEEYGG